MILIKSFFYQERTFGDKFNVTFEFIKQNWKLMLRYFAYVYLPLSFVAEFFMEAMMKNVMTLATDPEELMNLIPSYGGLPGEHSSLLVDGCGFLFPYSRFIMPVPMACRTSSLPISSLFLGAMPGDW